MPSTAADHPANSTTLTSGRINVLFFWQHDRWFHSLHTCHPDGTRGPAVWRTAFPAAEDDPQWPSSPPLSELAQVPGPGGTALVGLGRAGRSHFSMSVTAQADGSLIFECACRLATLPHWLGSTYVRSDPPATASPILIFPMQGIATECARDRGDGADKKQLLRVSPLEDDGTVWKAPEGMSPDHGKMCRPTELTSQKPASEAFFLSQTAAYDVGRRHPTGGLTVQWSYLARVADCG